MSYFRYIVAVLAILTTQSSYAYILEYAPALEQAQWSSASSKLRCKISQSIPGYGYAQFIRYAGKPLNLLIYSEEKPVRSGKAWLRSSPEAWKHNTAARELGVVKYSTRQPIFSIKRQLAQRTLFELEQGMSPYLYFKDWGVQGNEVRVAMSSIKFQPALEKFRACTAELIQYDYKTASNMKVFFPGGGVALTQAAIDRLDAVADYLLHDSEINLAYIEGHSDSAGEQGKNFELSKLRAEAAYSYLLRKGVPENKLKLRYYGQRRPVASNKTAAGRAKNRRVALRLVK